MGKLSAIADRIRDTKTRLDIEADKLAAKLDAIDEAAPVAFSRGHAFIAAQHAEVAEIEGTLRQLNNLPLDELPASPGGSLKAGPSASPAPETAPTGSAASPDHAAFVRRVQQP